MSITHATVASDPQVPKLTDTDWNAAHSNPTLAEVLAAGNDPAGMLLEAAAGTSEYGPYLGLYPDPGDGSGSGADLEGGGGTAGHAGGSATTAGGAGNGNTSYPGFAKAIGGGADGAGGGYELYGGIAAAASDKQGGDITLTPGAGDGAGRDGLVFLNLPTADPGVAGALYSDGTPSAGTPKALMVSGG